ncbi:MAG TPA: response regulator transcription factor [Pedococcus sp.]|nr:response regulator transcription factor [Pedococcus sp.]
MSPIRIVVVDDHQVFADALGVLLGTEDDLEVLAVARDAEKALIAAEELRPDVVLMDVDLPGMNGIAATRRMLQTSPGTRVIVLTALMDPEVVEGAAGAGAIGFVSKQRAADDLLGAIRAAARGEEVFRTQDLHVLWNGRVTGPERQRIFDLTSRELEVLQALADGLSTQEVASTLFLSRRTVQGHVQSILTKLQVRSKLEAVLYGLRHGLVRLKPTPA